MILIKSAFWVVITAILCCCACACLTSNSIQGSPLPGTQIPVIDKTPRDEQAKFPFEQAFNELEWYSSSENLNMTNMTIHQIHGSGLDSEGNASGWVFGTQQGEISLLLVYDRNGWHQVEWGEQFVSSDIILDEITLPTQLYKQNREFIVDTMKKLNVTETDVDLSEGIYTVTIRSTGGLSPMRFNASTGELLS